MRCTPAPRETAGVAEPSSAGGCGMRTRRNSSKWTATRLEEVLRRVEQSLDEEDSALVRAVFESYAYVADLVEDKNTSIRRLRQLFFGASTETTEAVVGRKAEKPEAACAACRRGRDRVARRRGQHRRTRTRRRPPRVTDATAPRLTGVPRGSS